MIVKQVEVSEEERKVLELGARSRSDLRQRERSQTILLLHEGIPSKEVARRLGVALLTIYERRNRWRAKGLLSLRDAPRSGSPGKLSDEMIASLKRWATEEALSAQALLSRLQAEFGIQVHLNTVKNAVKRIGFTWKRTRHSVKKKSTGALCPSTTRD